MYSLITYKKNNDLQETIKQLINNDLIKYINYINE